MKRSAHGGGTPSVTPKLSSIMARLPGQLKHMLIALGPAALSVDRGFDVHGIVVRGRHAGGLHSAQAELQVPTEPEGKVFHWT